MSERTGTPAQKFPRDDVVTRNILERQALSHPDETFIDFQDGPSWTRRAALESACSAAHALREAGVRQGDKLAILFPNGPDFIRAWWGAAMLGASIVPIHTAYRGGLLEHLLRLSLPVAVAGDPGLMHVLDEITERPLVPGLRLTAADLHSTNTTVPLLENAIETWDTQFYLLTSGTTGPSKLAACSYRNIYLGGCNIIAPLRGREDRLLIDLPLFHGAALRAALACLSTGTSMAVRTNVQLSNYWELLKETRATMSILMSSMVSFVEAQSPRPAERDHKVRVMSANPLPDDPRRFMDRFGVRQLHVLYGSTEVPGSIRAEPGDPYVHGYCGRQQPGYECRIVDEHDIEVPPGAPGELVVRHDQPWVIASEYTNNPAATAAAWRNGWFHTGDMLRREEDGRFFFVDRVKDSLRRRGENISSSEVETGVMAYPGVKEAACVACRAGGAGDDEVKVWIVADEGHAIDFEQLLRFCVERLPYFMVPRYFELTGALPKTHNQKIRKMELREIGNSSRTWDREAHGLQVTRHGIEVATG